MQLPWDPALSREELRRGQMYFGSGARLHKLAHKLLAGQPIKAVALGGSITGKGTQEGLRCRRICRGGGGRLGMSPTVQVSRFLPPSLQRS